MLAYVTHLLIQPETSTYSDLRHLGLTSRRGHGRGPSLLSRLTDPPERENRQGADRTLSLLQRIQDFPHKHPALYQRIQQPSTLSETLIESFRSSERGISPNPEPLPPSQLDSTSISLKMSQKNSRHSNITSQSLNPTNDSLMKRLNVEPMSRPGQEHSMEDQHSRSRVNQSEREVQPIKMKRLRSLSPSHPRKTRNVEDIDNTVTRRAQTQETRMNQTTVKDHPVRGRRFMRGRCPGINEKSPLAKLVTQVQTNPDVFYFSSETTCPQSSVGSASPKLHLEEDRKSVV